MNISVFRRPYFPAQERLRGAALLLCCAAMLWTSRPAAAQQGADGPLLLLAVGDLRGEIKPCGCSPEGQMGGLPRRLTYLAPHFRGGTARAVVVDLGNNFPAPSPQGSLKIDLIQQMLKRFPPAAILPGPNELAFGPGRLDSALPYLVSNNAVGKAFLPFRAVKLAGRRIGLFGYLSPTEVYQGSQGHFRLTALSPALIEAWRARRRRENLDRAVLLFRGSDAELAGFVKAGLFDRIVAGNPHSDELNQVVQRKVEGREIAQVPTKGQGLVRMPLMEKHDAYTVDWLTKNYADHADSAQPFKDYDAKVKALFFAQMETMKKQNAESPFIGAATCKACHAPAHEKWSGSRHAGAIATLQKVGKQFDPECLACHVVGLNRGGYLSQQLTPGLAGVQCENCHGPAKAHRLNPKANQPGWVTARNGGRSARVGEGTCRTCHVGSHSPTFKFEAYWPRIKH